ncbi:MAG TPA: ABC transporter permease subunit [Gemmatimonadales bacterium]|nr:ABC transporter permease subunit [Gemmatimonadales bacterium]
MTTMLPVLRPMIRETLRSRWLLALVLGLVALGELLLRFGGGGPTTLVSLLDVALIVTPLAGLVVGTMQLHHGREMTELLLAQPVTRGRLFVVLYLGAALPLALALVIGLLAPFAWHGMLAGPGALRVLGLAATAGTLAFITTAIAFVIAMRVDDRVRALSVALVAWCITTILWDGLVLLVALLLGEHPIEVPLMLMLALNPVDVARVLLLLGSDAAALLGYTGAMLARLLGTATGRLALLATLALWILGPCLAARRVFQQKDF